MSQRDDSRYWYGMDKHTVPQGSQYWEDKRTGMDKHRQKPDEETEKPENIDFSFVCMAAEVEMDKKETDKICQLEKEKGLQQHYYTENWIAFDDNEYTLIVKCEKDLEQLKKYVLWSNANNGNIMSLNKKFHIAHEALEDYLISRMENIHNILESFFLHGDIDPETYTKYIEKDNMLRESLEETINTKYQLENRNTLILDYSKVIIEQILDSLKDFYLNSDSDN